MKRFWKLVLVAMATLLLFATAWQIGKLSADIRSGMMVLERVRLEDLGELQRYRSANADLAPDPDRVVFFGDSITYFWDLKRYFPTEKYLNRGIGGQTSGDMLVRFRQDVIEIKPGTVVILAGINDFLWRDKMSDSNEQTLKNLEANDETMAELSEVHHIRPVFVSLLPLNNYNRAAKKVYAKVPEGVVVAANSWLKGFCAQHGYQYIDEHSAMVDERGMLRRELSDDGIHPNEAGYSIMSKTFSQAFH